MSDNIHVAHNEVFDSVAGIEIENSRHAIVENNNVHDNAGGLLAFAFAMLEVSDSLILAQKQAFYPITKAIMELFQLLGDGKFIASALGVWAMVFLGVTIVGMSLLLGKKLGAIFRV